MKLYLLGLLAFAGPVHAQDVLNVCVDYHCERKQKVKIDAREWQTILKPFKQPATSAQQERQQIRESISQFEKIVGSHTPTNKDMAENKGEDEPGQLDCIAESTNSLLYLQLLQGNERLKWHTVNERVKRSPRFFDVHWGVKITENKKQTEYVVDSWYGANGDLPNIQPLTIWQNQ